MADTAPKIYYVRWVPGKADGVTLPPLGIFIEKDDKGDRGLTAHEKGHWKQYEEWGFCKYYWTVLKQYWKYGTIEAPIEADATERGKDL